MIKMLILILIGVIIGWSVPKPVMIDTMINKIKNNHLIKIDFINNIIKKFK